MTIAVTGATGFVGTALIAQAHAAEFDVRALARRKQPPAHAVVWIDGALDQPDALANLVIGVDAVIHVAGVVNAPNRGAFEAGNAHGTAAMITAAREAGVRRFVHVSSLSAREPGLSNYGWSKAESERLVMASGLDWTIVRPPAIYGPHDLEMLEMFRMAARGLVLLPPPGRFSLIEVSDLARLLLALARDNETSIGQVYEPDDGRPKGWSHRGFARALGRAVGRTVSTLSLPASALRMAARGDRLLRRGRARLTADRAAYFCHPDWTVGADKRPPAFLWRPQVDTQKGLSETARWYRNHRLLR